VRIVASVSIAALSAWCLFLTVGGIYRADRYGYTEIMIAVFVVLPVVALFLAWLAREVWRGRLLSRFAKPS
jgi:hypothetical protein